MFEVAIVVLGILAVMGLFAIANHLRRIEEAIQRGVVQVSEVRKEIGKMTVGLRAGLSRRGLPPETPGFYSYGGKSEAYQAALDRARSLSGS